MQLTPIKATTGSRRIDLVIQSDGTLLITEADSDASLTFSGDDISFLLDYLLTFIGESQRRQTYHAWKLKTGLASLREIANQRAKQDSTQ
jgi:hypothetical protein